ncbi:MAG: ATP-binding protein, partial [Pseudomonadales bacterium]
VLDELVANIINHGYPGAKDEIEIGIRIQLSATTATIRVIDTGIQFDPMALEIPDTTSLIDERQIGGLGVYLCKQLVDEIAYERRERRNHLTITKQLSASNFNENFQLEVSA